MRETKNQKGITLIALIVTIIVLIIIAGISIATLTSDNGVIRQVNTAKVTQIEATAREQMDLACSAMRLAIAEASARDNSYKANKNAEKIQDVLLSTVKADSTELESASWIEGTLDSDAGTFTITYEGDDYKNACNDDAAKITYTITLAQRSIEVTDVATGIKDSDGNDTSIDIGAGSGNTGSGSGSSSGEGDSGSGTGSSGGSTPSEPTKLETPTTLITGDTLTITEVTNATSYEVYVNGTLMQTLTTGTLDLTALGLEAGDYEITVIAKADGYTESDTSIKINYTVPEQTAYLVDKVVIGDYVDIGISYTNQMTFTSTNADSNFALTGWRVLSKSGSGATGTVELVSAGVPLKYYHNMSTVQAETAIKTYLSNLNAEIQIVNDEDTTAGFSGNGFSSNNLANIWSSNSKINGETAHAMTTTELETLYGALTGTAYTVASDDSDCLIKTANMESVAEGNNKTWSNRTNDLLGNGMTYWLSGSAAHYKYSLWYVDTSGYVDYLSMESYGVRPVVSLIEGTEIASDNTGTGAYGSAYKLAD